MKSIRWLPHALQSLIDREIEKSEADITLLTLSERPLAMRVTYDEETDSLVIWLRDARIKESDEVRPGVIADFGYDDDIVRFEILNASRVVQKTREIQFAIA